MGYILLKIIYCLHEIQILLDILYLYLLNLASSSFLGFLPTSPSKITPDTQILFIVKVRAILVSPDLIFKLSPGPCLNF